MKEATAAIYVVPSAERISEAASVWGNLRNHLHARTAALTEQIRGDNARIWGNIGYLKELKRSSK